MSAHTDNREITPNRLIHEKSPYLLQHAYNPVDWHPWGGEAFENARKEDRLVFLSVGYSTCHWCHVMAHESFEDTEVARLLNEAFICVKVDREERPDIDRVYMDACQMLTGSGGWPLTVVMTPDRQPVFAATYIPKETGFGRIGMLDLIPKIEKIWKERRADVLDSAGRIVSLMQKGASESRDGNISEEMFDAAYEDLRKRFDEEKGGFGAPPRFPMPHQLMLLLRYGKWTKKEKALAMVQKTLQAMRRGGIYDHVGYGFHRYSTDAEWLVPHFEKMLYDQALLAMAYTEAFQATGDKVFGETAREILTYVLRDMAAPEGGFYAAEDADSEGEEGRFYLWTYDEIEEALPPEEAALVIRLFHVERGGNFVDEATRKKTGRNVLHLKKTVPQTLQKKLAEAKRTLFAVRKKRVHPYKDDKILTDWNGLMIAAFAKGFQVFADPQYRKAAEDAVHFILKNMIGQDGRILHRYRDGEAAVAANLDDYAFFIWGLMECYEAFWDAKYFLAALSLQEDLTRHFLDKENGGYFFTPDDGEAMIIRRKEVYDGAVPSGNSVNLLNLIRLARMKGDAEIEKQAVVAGRAFAGSVGQMPAGFAQFLIALGFLVYPSHEIVIAGSRSAKDTEEMIGELRRHFLPECVVLFHPAKAETPDIASVVPRIRGMLPLHGRATAYVCTGFTCQGPTADPADMLRLLL
jgi:hypothetical protein